LQLEGLFCYVGNGSYKPNFALTIDYLETELIVITVGMFLSNKNNKRIVDCDIQGEFQLFQFVQ
jgi:hypothetical protein